MYQIATTRRLKIVAANDRYPSLAALHQRPVAGLKSCKITPS